LSYGDAISTEVIALQRVFIEAGFESAIFAINVHPFYLGRSNTARGPIKKFGELQRVVHGEASLLLHYSLGSPLNELFREIKGYRRIFLKGSTRYLYKISPVVAKSFPPCASCVIFWSRTQSLTPPILNGCQRARGSTVS
jgi:hypothetical protein